MPEPHALLMNDLIVEHQRDLLREASAERQAGTPRPVNRSGGRRRPWPSLIPAVRQLAVAWTARRTARWTASVLLAVLLAAAGQGRAESATMSQIVTALAENVLGRGAVQAVRISTDATVVIRWEAATYRPQNSVAASRELLYDEASLVTGAILGSLRDVRRITFTLVRGGQVWAAGEIAQSGDLVLRFAPQLGGGIHTKPSSQLKVPVSGGGRAESLL
jgi:hypothetical protein